MDFTPENWTQQLMSTRLNDDSMTLTLDQPYVDIDLEDTFDTTSDYMRHSAPITTHPPGDLYFPSNSLGSDMSLAPPAIDHDLKAFHTPEQMSLLDLKDADLTTWSYNTPRPDIQPIQDIWVLERPHQPIPILLDPSNSSFCQLQSPDTSPDTRYREPVPRFQLQLLQARDGGARDTVKSTHWTGWLSQY
ncbi:hypothetical protein N7466_010776 [Penicillium verhagenii]|uniref:uncharacterized protein n=1 Tax=Penicillium verhagenii TaxID=1562060 RepID=UPI0025454500|nr:uncharacterized protein N7466_010776 [Penicillium verhagenii]KAJ5917222.1 hypothetical protein N7466_010776 [Penicillium verhagenii]